jgi:hypothetical protein
MSVRSAAETRQNYIDAMGEELGAVYAQLWQELVTLHSKWCEYVELFGTNELRFELMREAAPTFFLYTVHNVLLESTMVHIARLTDPSETPFKGENGPPRQNLTIKRMPCLMTDKRARKQTNKAIAEAEIACRFARQWRNRQIAHGDLSLALDDPPPEPLSPPSRLQVRKALESLTAAMNVVSKHYMDETSMLDDRPVIGGALELLHVVRDGDEVRRSRIERLKSGIPHADDFRRREF